MTSAWLMPSSSLTCLIVSASSRRSLNARCTRIYLYFASKLFFCKLHRAFCIYIGVASLDIDLHNWFDLDFLEPQWLIPLIMITTAVVLITLAWRKKIQCYG